MSDDTNYEIVLGDDPGAVNARVNYLYSIGLFPRQDLMIIWSKASPGVEHAVYIQVMIKPLGMPMSMYPSGQAVMPGRIVPMKPENQEAMNDLMKTMATPDAQAFMAKMSKVYSNPKVMKEIELGLQELQDEVEARHPEPAENITPRELRDLLDEK